MTDQSALLSELFGSVAVRAVNVRVETTPAGAALTVPEDAGSDEYAHPNLARSGHFHWLLEGEATLQSKAPSPLLAGHAVLFPRAVTRDANTEPAPAAVICTTPCRWITGNFSAGNPATTRLLHGLPAVLPPPSDTALATSTLLPLVQSELTTSNPGAHAVINGAFHILFIHTLRSFITQLSHNAAGWFRASLDSDIGPVLLLLHARPEEPWTVATMAEQALMSRSSFAAKFNELVGEPPLQYLTKYRMDKARMMLREETQPVKEIARTVGYVSEAAFSTAFRRTEGIAPGSVRKIARAAGGNKENAAPAA